MFASKNSQIVLRLLACVFFIVSVVQAFPIIRSILFSYDSGPGMDFVFIASWTFIPLAISVLLFSFSLRRPRIAYWSLYIFVWLIGISIWYQQNNGFSTRLTGIIMTPDSLWPWILLSVGISVLLIAFYKPIIFMLKHLMNIPVSMKAQVKDAPPDEEEYMQQMQRYRD